MHAQLLGSAGHHMGVLVLAEGLWRLFKKFALRMQLSFPSSLEFDTFAMESVFNTLLDKLDNVINALHQVFSL